MSDAAAWGTLLALGAFHGINPAMGWLFAVALGLQQRRRRAVLMAVLPIGLGHLLAILGVLLLAAALGRTLTLAWLRWGVGVGLILFGALKLVRTRHPRWVAMRVNARDLTVWSFLMASAHGAGLMLLPVLFRWAADGAGGAHAGHGHATATATVPLGVLATAVHTLGYLVTLTIVAVVIYEKVGLAIIRKAWFNLDRVWALALMLAGVLTLVI